jgi:hypothetical protein
VSVATIRNTTRAESSINRMDVTLGHWLADNAPAGATIGCDDVGAIGYFSDRRIFDLHGLVTRQILGYGQDPEGFMAFLTAWKPTFLAIFPALYPALKDAPFLKAVGYADSLDNTASALDFRPRPRTIAGLLILDLTVQPVPVALAVFKCSWDLLPPPAAGAR